jgi:hypothetical protein
MLSSLLVLVLWLTIGIVLGMGTSKIVNMSKRGFRKKHR